MEIKSNGAGVLFGSITWAVRKEGDKNGLMFIFKMVNVTL